MTWSLLQSAANYTTSYVTSLTVTPSSNLSSGSKLIAYTSIYASGQECTGISDAGGNNFTQVANTGLPAGVGNGGAQLWVLDTPAGDVGTMPVFTASFPNGASPAMVQIQEVSGLLAGTTASLDGTAATLANWGSQTGGTISTGSPSYSSTAANEYLLSAICLYTNSSSLNDSVAPAALTADPNNPSSETLGCSGFAYGNSTDGTETDGWTITASGAASEFLAWGVILVAFQLASVGPAITTISLPYAVAGQPYSATLAATGGTAPYTWSISSGALPAWASLNTSTGVISGTPTGAWNTNFTVEVTDNTSLTATRALSLDSVYPAAVRPSSVVRAQLPNPPRGPGVIRGGRVTSNPGIPYGAVRQVGSPTATVTTATGTISTAWSANQPRNKGDLLLAVITGAASTSFTVDYTATTSGWQQVVAQGSTTTVHSYCAVFYKIASGADPAPTFTATETTTIRIVASLFELSGAGLQPTFNTGTYSTGSSTITGATITTGSAVAQPGSFAVAGLARYQSTAAITKYNPSAGWQNVYNDGSASTGEHNGTDVFGPTAGGPYYPAPPVGAALSDIVSLTSSATSFGAGVIVVVNPSNSGPYFYPQAPAIRARLPYPLGRTRLAGVYMGAAPKDTSSGTGQIQWNAGGPVQNVIPPPGPLLRNYALRAMPVPLLRGRTYSRPGAPLKNPQPGPVFTQAHQPIRSQIPQVFSKGRVSGSTGAPLKNPQPGPVFTQAVHPIRAVIPQVFSKGRIASSAGAPLKNPSPGPVFRQAVHPAAARLPVPFLKGRVSSNPGAPLRNPNAGPVFTQAVRALRARLPVPFLKGRASSNPGGPLRNPHPGPVFTQAAQPARARIQPPPRGRIWSNPGTPYVAPPAPAGISSGQPAGIRVIYLLTGRTQSSPTAPATQPPPPATGPAFHPAAAVRAKLPAARRGTCRAIRFGPLPANPSQGPAFTQATSPARARSPLPPRGRTASNPGGPVRNPVPAGTGPVFRPATSPARIRPAPPPRGRIASNSGAPVRNPVAGPVFRPAVHPVQVRFPLPPKGRSGSNAGGPYVPPPVTGPRFYPADSPVRARIPRNAPRGRTCSNAGGPVHNPTPGPVFRQAVRPAQVRVPQVFSKGRTGSNPGGPVVNPPAPVYPWHGPVRAHPAFPPRGRTGSNPGIPVTVPTSGPKVYPAKGPVQARRPLPPHGRITLGNKGAAVHNPTAGPVFRQAVRPIRAVIPQNAPRGRTGSNPGGPVENIPFATLRFRTGTPYFQWATGTPEFQWSTGTPEAG